MGVRLSISPMQTRDENFELQIKRADQFRSMHSEGEFLQKLGRV